ncbi:PREDICTED: transcription initiation factor TFIID subunit 5-like [Merops nubicus]|uniref:transcription initiation factor TFIID subunit 5-like n=1 Tax=Merops nubicus TaxID=57421 RepID=UPI0004F01BFF|nr:PREDICTED: transcription initiation factor TFIID subunit 5-like [Merops nubicus]
MTYFGNVSSFFLHTWNPNGIRHRVKYLIANCWQGKCKKWLKVLGELAVGLERAATLSLVLFKLSAEEAQDLVSRFAQNASPYRERAASHCMAASSSWLSHKLLLYADAFAVGGGVVVEDQPDVSAVLSAYNQQGDPTLYEEYYSGLKHFIECSLDCHRAELSQLFYPLFVHMYLELVYNQHESEAKSFFERFHGDQECYYQDDLRVLSSLTKKEHMKGNETMLDFRTSKFVLRISRDSYQLLKRHLQEKQNNQIWNIVQEHLYIDIFDGMPRSKQQIDAMVGSLAGEAKREANKAKVFFGLLKEPEFDVPLDDEDEEGENEEGKPKKKKPKKDSVGSKSKKQDPNAPPQNRIPLPELKDSDKLDRVMNMKEAARRVRLGPECLPSICFYTFLNAYQGLTAVDITDDSSMIVGGFADSTVRVWSVTPKKLRSVKTAADLSLIDKESDDVLERIMDEKTASELKILYGHSGPVYGTSFSPDR